jgi:two-component system capsular synthesis sensor histidine kinase RcsC
MSDPTPVLRKRILLTDDRPEVRQTLRMMLDLDEHIVSEAADAREALELFKPDQFDLVMTDYAMPGMRGDELARNIKARAPSQHILMVTGSAEACRGLGGAADAILPKPFTLQELRRAIAAMC